MKIKLRLSPVPWLYIRLKKDPVPVYNAPVSLSMRDGDFVLTKDEPGGPLDGSWMIMYNGYMYDNPSLLKTIWVFLTEKNDDRYLVG